MPETSTEIIIDPIYYSQETSTINDFKLCISDTLNLIIPVICCAVIITGIIVITSIYFGQ